MQHRELGLVTCSNQFLDGCSMSRICSPPHCRSPTAVLFVNLSTWRHHTNAASLLCHHFDCYVCLGWGMFWSRIRNWRQQPPIGRSICSAQMAFDNSSCMSRKRNEAIWCSFLVSGSKISSENQQRNGHYDKWLGEAFPSTDCPRKNHSSRATHVAGAKVSESLLWHCTLYCTWHGKWATMLKRKNQPDHCKTRKFLYSSSP